MVFVEFIGLSISTSENILFILQTLSVIQFSLYSPKAPKSLFPVKDIFVDSNKQISNEFPLSIL